MADRRTSAFTDLSADEPLVPLSLLSRALDEIYALRRALAYEAACTVAHLGFKTLPKRARWVAEEQIGRMRAAARGEVANAYSGQPRRSLDAAMREAGASETLTLSQWKAETDG